MTGPLPFYVDFDRVVHQYPLADDPVVCDSASGEWLPGVPDDALVREGRGHAWQPREGAWALASVDDDEEAVYRAVVVRVGSQVCAGAGCVRTTPMRVDVYRCGEHAEKSPDASVKSGVDMSIPAVVRSPHQPDDPAITGPGPNPDEREPDMAASRKSKATAAFKSGVADILDGTGTADDALASIAAAVEADGGTVETVETPQEAADASAARADAFIPATVRNRPAKAAKPKASKSAVGEDIPRTFTAPDPLPAPAVELVEGTPLAHLNGRTVITIETRDAILAGKDRALKAAVKDGIYIRPNGSLPAGKVKETGTDPKFYPRWRLAIVVPEGAEVEATTIDGGWGWNAPDRVPGQTRTRTVTEKAARAPRMQSPEAVAKAAKISAAKATLAAVEALPGTAYTEAIGTDEVQAAIETIGSSREASDD